MIGALYRLVFANVIGNFLIALANLFRWPRALRRTRWITVTIKSPLPARPVRKRWFGKRQRSLADIAELFDELAKDRRIEGVVVRIRAAPGGWARVQSLHAVIAKLRASGKRASGGYYLACAAHRIVAQPLTLTGSIGVVAGKLNLQGLYEKLGIASVVLTRGEVAAMNRSSRGYSDEERRRLAAEIDAMYEQFVRKVAEGRDMSHDEAEAVAQGRVWTGADAHERKLVDQLGDVTVAIDAARELARRKPSEQLDVVDARVSPRQGFLSRALGGTAAQMKLPGPLAELSDYLQLADERVLMLPSYTLRIR